ncbi:uncharacterized protein METZ01_LOCUS197527, partial [marine metagenome]
VVDEEYGSHLLTVTAECACRVLNLEERVLDLYQNGDGCCYLG